MLESISLSFRVFTAKLMGVRIFRYLTELTVSVCLHAFPYHSRTHFITVKFTVFVLHLFI